MNTVVSNPEVIFGLVGPIGVDLESVTEHLADALTGVGYNAHTIRLTTEMQSVPLGITIDDSSYFKKYESLIKYADAFREKCSHNGAMAGLAIQAIRKKRFEISNDYDTPALGNAFIVRQFKRPEEILIMRQTYGRKFIQVSTYLSREERERVLVRKINEFDNQPRSEAEAEAQAATLIDMDHEEKGHQFGQNISGMFHLGDVFVLGSSKSEIEQTISRFIDAMFGKNNISPTKEEYGMYISAAASYRSVDLSRQVGEAIFTSEGEVIAMGCNEVPKPFGGTYWHEGGRESHRDIDRGRDENHRQKVVILNDFMNRLEKNKLLSERALEHKNEQGGFDRLIEIGDFRESRLMDIIEFGRMIHAEMSAIMDAARLGRPVSGATLFCTTFPCHVCAKHIVAAGIVRVIFLEPYPKSYAKELHSDAISFDPNEKNKRVIFEPFIGISPRRYRDIFEKGARKDASGVAQPWYDGRPVPRIEDRSPSYIENENPSQKIAFGKLAEEIDWNAIGQDEGRVGST